MLYQNTLKRARPTLLITVCALLLLTMRAPVFADEKVTVSSDIVTALKNATDDIENLDRQIETMTWLQQMSRNIEKRVPDHDYRFKLLRTVLDEALRANIDPQLALAVMAIESNFNEKATSNVGAQGLMQVMPFWKDEIGNSWDDLYDMQTNIRYGCEILQIYLQRYSPSVSRALAGYNGSLGRNKYPNKVLSRLKKYWEYEAHFSLKEPEIIAIETNINAFSAQD